MQLLPPLLPPPRGSQAPLVRLMALLPVSASCRPPFNELAPLTGPAMPLHPPADGGSHKKKTLAQHLEAVDETAVYAILLPSGFPL